jgi:hypothetical protein
MADRKSFRISDLKGTLGRIRDYMVVHRVPPLLLFFTMGIISTIWFLVRVIPKPSRATYPCMKVAAPLMSGFVVYILSLGGMTFALQKAKHYLYRARYFAAASFLIAAVAFSLVSLTHHTNDSYAGILPATGPDDGPNQPMGIAQGANPGRVVWVWNPDATNEKCISNFDTQDWFFKPENTNGKVVREMLRNSLTSLTGKKNIKDSWKTLFITHNQKKYGKSVSYKKGEKIFIKINQGTSRLGLTKEEKEKGFYYPKTLKPGEERRKPIFGATETGPYVVLELLRELVYELGVDQNDIAVGDPMTDICGHNYEVWSAEFPEVTYTGKFSSNFGRTLIKPTEKELLFYSDKTQSDKLYDVLEKADYLINVACLKPHMSAGISLTAKNHFGSQARENAAHLHYALIVPIGSKPLNVGYHKYRVLVDLMGSKYLGQNTVLYLVEGLFGGGSSETRAPVKYLSQPFNNDWCSSIFASQDQVALESVCFDILRTEWNGKNKHDPANNASEDKPNMNGVDDYLHQAADRSNWPEGISYDPDNSGKPLSSLGTHEHWNNSVDRQYSRNLGLNTGIELVTIPDTLVKNPAPALRKNQRQKK